MNGTYDKETRASARLQHNSNTSNNNKPKTRDLVPLLMNQKEDFLKDIRKASVFVVRGNVKHSLWECPTNERCKNGEMVFIEEGIGFNRAYRH